MAQDLTLKLTIGADGKAAVSVLNSVEAAEKRVANAADDAGNKSKQAAAKSEGAWAGMLARLKGVGAGLAAAFGAKAISDATIAVEQQRKALEFAAGGAAAAKVKLAELTETARAQGIKVSELTDTWIRLKNLGLDASARALTAYSNISAANAGKSINDFAEAVADAMTGEFERLKEFGIKASVQADQVALRFRGATIMVANDAKAIERALIRFGEADFAGAAAAKADTLGAALDRLTDSTQRLMAAGGEGSVAGFAKKFMLGLSNVFDSLAAEAPADKRDEWQRTMDDMFSPSAAVADTMHLLASGIGGVGDATTSSLDALSNWIRAARGLAPPAEAAAQAARDLADAQAALANAPKGWGDLSTDLSGVNAARTAFVDTANAMFEASKAATEWQAAYAKGVQEATAGILKARESDQALTEGRIALAQQAIEIERTHAQTVAQSAAEGKALAEADTRRQMDLMRLEATADQQRILSARRNADLARESAKAAQTEVDQITRLGGHLKELKKAKEDAAAALSVSREADLKVKEQELSAIANAAKRAADALSGMASAEKSLQDAQAKAAGTAQGDDWAKASLAAADASDQLRRSNPVAAAKIVEDAMATLQRAVESGGPAALIDATRRQLHALGEEARAFIKAAPTKVQEPAPSTTIQDQAAQVEALRRAYEAAGLSIEQTNARIAEFQRRADPGQVRTPIEQSLQTPIQVKLDAKSSAIDAARVAQREISAPIPISFDSGAASARVRADLEESLRSPVSARVHIDAKAAAGDVSTAIEAAMRKPIPINLDATAAGSGIVQQIKDALAGASFSVPVTAVITPVYAGTPVDATAGGGTLASEVQKAAEKMGTR